MALSTGELCLYSPVAGLGAGAGDSLPGLGEVWLHLTGKDDLACLVTGREPISITGAVLLPGRFGNVDEGAQSGGHVSFTEIIDRISGPG